MRFEVFLFNSNGSKRAQDYKFSLRILNFLNSVINLWGKDTALLKSSSFALYIWRYSTTICQESHSTFDPALMGKIELGNL